VTLLATKQLICDLKLAKDAVKAEVLQRYFKTEPGGYGEGDKFLGVRVPKVRKIAIEYTKQLNAKDLNSLLQSRWHEVRQAALFVMVKQFEKAENKKQKELFELYIKNINKGINNWDLIDLTSPKIVGAYLLKKDRSVLYKLAKGSLWHKRVSIISTFWFLKHGELQDTYKLAEVLLCEKHDLLQKAVGWSLREMGKFDFKLLCKFLDEYAATMPRTALRYSLEKFPQERRQYYMKLNKKIVR